LLTFTLFAKRAQEGRPAGSGSWGEILQKLSFVNLKKFLPIWCMCAQCLLHLQTW